MLIYQKFVTKLQFEKHLYLIHFQHVFLFLVENNHYPIDNVLDQIIQQKIQLKYYLIKLFLYFPFVMRDIIFVEVLHLNEKY
eukprot:gene24088-gene19414